MKVTSTSRIALRQLGENLRIARLRRRFGVRDMAERCAVAPETIRRLERGEAGVGVGVLAMYLATLGLRNVLQNLTDAQADDIGLLEDIGRLPQRVRRPRGRQVER